MNMSTDASELSHGCQPRELPLVSIWIFCLSSEEKLHLTIEKLMQQDGADSVGEELGQHFLVPDVACSGGGTMRLGGWRKTQQLPSELHAL